MIIPISARTSEWLPTHREYVTPGNTYDTGVDVFRLMLDQGLKSNDRVCDVGCGSLRVGRFLIAYLEHSNYYAMEPNRWLVDAAVEEEIGTLAEVKQANFEFGRNDFNIREIFGFSTRFDWVLISAVLIHVDHVQLKEALKQACSISNRVLFDTFPQGPDHTETGWLYPQIAPHYDTCITDAVRDLSHKLVKVDGLDSRGAQWWRLDALRN